MFKIHTISLLLMLLILGCSQVTPQNNPQKSSSQMPNWIYSPNRDGKLGGVGSSRPHFKGATYQRDLAIQRALNELAKQHGVQVHTESSQMQIDNNGKLESRSGQYSFQTSDGVVNAHIAEVWQDQTTKELFVWMRDN